jgi:MFS family permease
MIKLQEKIGYGFGDMASSMFWKLFGSYLMIFYTDVFGMPAAVVGTMFLVTRIWDSAFDPIVGVIADRTQSRWGKFRPYLLYLAIPFALIGILTFMTPDLSDTGKIVYAYITYSLMMMVYSAINVPYASLLGVISPESKEVIVLFFKCFKLYYTLFILERYILNGNTTFTFAQNTWLQTIEATVNVSMISRHIKTMRISQPIHAIIAVRNRDRVFLNF